MESPTENIAIELLEPIVLRKENCAPIEFEQGTILKVLLVNPNSYLVTVDDEFNFTVSLEDENKAWRKL